VSFSATGIEKEAGMAEVEEELLTMTMCLEV
jgi:hypothetical protein